jgi:hypothetical protein
VQRVNAVFDSGDNSHGVLSLGKRCSLKISVAEYEVKCKRYQ